MKDSKKKSTTHKLKTDFAQNQKITYSSVLHSHTVLMNYALVEDIDN